VTREGQQHYQPLWRLILVITVICALLGVIGWRVLDLQILNNTVLQRQGDARTVRNDSIVATRGNIVDRNGEPLAISTPVLSLWLNPKEILSNPQQGPLLADAMHSIDINPEWMNQRIIDAASREFLYIKRGMPPAEAEVVLERKLKGVYAKEEYKRYYPMGEAAVHVVGLAGSDEVGQEGLELAYEDWLKGKQGSKQVLKDRLGRIIREVKINENPQPGQDLTLAMDSRLQYIAYKALKEAVTQRNAVAGTATVLDVRTGEILAMVSQPSYNPNNRNTMTDSAKKNRVMVDLMEPGSTAKTFSITAALETGLFTLDSVVDFTRCMRIDSTTICDPVNYGPAKLERIIAKSSNIGVSHLALAMGEAPMLDVLGRMGFGQNLGTGFPGETSGVLPAHNRWSKSEIATLSYGYGFQVTPLQLAQAYLVYANKGLRKPVSFLKVNHEVAGERVIAEPLANIMTQLLRGVVGKELGGTGTKANIPSYQVAGKTGTTWYYDVAKGGYDTSKYISHFAGFAPATDPRVVIVVSIQQPQGKQYGGGDVAAPVFAQIAAGAMRVLNVPPDRNESDIQAVSMTASAPEAQ